MAQNNVKTGKKRRGPGRPFQKGQSGNPGGRPAIPADVIEAARTRTPVALATLEAICTRGKDEKARIAAAVALLDRAWGKPTERTEIAGGNKPIEFATAPLTLEERAARVIELLRLAQARRDAGERPAERDQ